MYRSTPEILRFHSIPPFIFPLQSLLCTCTELSSTIHETRFLKLGFRNTLCLIISGSETILFIFSTMLFSSPYNTKDREKGQKVNIEKERGARGGG